MPTALPIEASKRHIILDALRGFALLGICMANFPEFSLYSFLPAEAAASMPTSACDSFVKYLLSIFVDGKFYTIFSLLFGIGFSIIISNVAKRGGNAFAVFYRRMLILLIIGFLHLMFIWSGDILMLYALMGMILPFFIKVSDKVLLWCAGILLFLPVIFDLTLETIGVSLSAPVVDWQWKECAKVGITADNFAYWLRDADSYGKVFDFLIQGAVVRLQEFIDGHRWFKVLGLFMIGLYIGRHRMYADLVRRKDLLRKAAACGLCLGLPLSFLYACDSMAGHPFGTGAHSLIYFASVYLTAFGYIGAICLLYLRCRNASCWKILAYPGRMALTNYIGQSLIGMLIYYGTGFGFGADTGLIYVELTVICVFFFQICFSALWLRFFRFGPLEWIWRCLTYLRLFPLRKSTVKDAPGAKIA
ncbi:MAG: DUF418 domain-containing protein [Muribaculaceae bacterium]|nr:DUF418 domain-containing protein [Muribaculaceae bacterium]